MFGGVPESALFAGLVGTIPYAITSLGTVWLTWDINAATVGAHALKGATSSTGIYPLLY
jgi:hypothetical protein